MEPGCWPGWVLLVRITWFNSFPQKGSTRPPAGCWGRFGGKEGHRETENVTRGEGWDRTLGRKAGSQARGMRPVRNAPECSHGGSKAEKQSSSVLGEASDRGEASVAPRGTAGAALTQQPLPYHPGWDAPLQLQEESSLPHCAVGSTTLGPGAGGTGKDVRTPRSVAGTPITVPGSRPPRSASSFQMGRSWAGCGLAGCSHVGTQSFVLREKTGNKLKLRMLRQLHRLHRLQNIQPIKEFAIILSTSINEENSTIMIPNEM